MNETLYNANNIGDKGIPHDDLKRLDQNSGAENSCLPIGSLKHTKQQDITGVHGLQLSESESKRQTLPLSLSGQSFYIDADVPVELRSKVGLNFI